MSDREEELGAAATAIADAATLSGELPIGELPTGELPTGELPTGADDAAPRSSKCLAADPPTVDKHRALGNDCFRAGQYEAAVHHYTYALQLLILRQRADYTTRTHLLNNRSMAFFHCGEFADSELDASLALASAEPLLRQKAYFRRGLARRAMHKLEGARQDFKACYEIQKFAKALHYYQELGKEPTCADLFEYMEQHLSRLRIDTGERVLISLVPIDWWDRFRACAVGATDASPGPIDTTSLLEDAPVVPPDRDASKSSEVERSNQDDELFLKAIALKPFNDGMHLRPDLTVGKEVTFVLESMWQILVQKFSGGPQIRRPLITRSSLQETESNLYREGAVLNRSCFTVELAPCTIFVSNPKANYPTKCRILCSRTTTIRRIRQEMSFVLVIPLTDLRLIRHCDSGEEGNVNGEVLPDDISLHALGICNGGLLFADFRGPTGLWSDVGQRIPSVIRKSGLCNACFHSTSFNVKMLLPCTKCNAAFYCSSDCRKSHWPWHRDICGCQPPPNREPGAVGLVNAGNSCYLNAALQCLSHTHELTRWFLSNKFMSDINRTNPLGLQGRLAEAYASLLKDIWFGRSLVVDPVAFRRTVSSFAPQFAGSEQHDAQEVLAFLLDGLHEDLNRIYEKPYCPIPDSAGRSDDEVSRESWRNHLRRNQSIVVDSLLGQFKSEVACSAGCTPSVTFDAFMYVSLPFPIVKPQHSNVRRQLLFYPKFGNRPTSVSIHLSASLVTCEQLFAALRPRLAQLDLMTSQDNDLFAGISQVASPLVPLSAESRFDWDLLAKSNLAVFEISKNSFPVPFIIRQLSDASYPPQFFLRGLPGIIEFENGTRMVPGAEIYRRIRVMFRRAMKDAPESGRCDVDCDVFSFTVGIDISDRSIGRAVSIVVTDSDSEYEVHPGMNMFVEFTTHCLISHFDMAEYLCIDPVVIEKAKSTTSLSPDLSIYDCLRAFTTAETLDISDWHCRNCGPSVPGSKRMSFWRLPDVLILHLKRFDSVRRHVLFGESANKISKKVVFPLVDLDLSPFMSNLDDPKPPKYDLFAVCNHFGASFFGHYTSLAKGIDGVWRHFDDESVHTVSDDLVCNSNAYVLFYRRQSPDVIHHSPS